MSTRRISDYSIIKGVREDNREDEGGLCTRFEEWTVVLEVLTLEADCAI